MPETMPALLSGPQAYSQSNIGLGPIQINTYRRLTQSCRPPGTYLAEQLTIDLQLNVLSYREAWTSLNKQFSTDVNGDDRVWVKTTLLEAPVGGGFFCWPR
eukprot:COSAG02_NODE_42202_length_386_cov_1.756098_1_plen_100_part_10